MMIKRGRDLLWVEHFFKLVLKIGDSITVAKLLRYRHLTKVEKVEALCFRFFYRLFFHPVTSLSSTSSLTGYFGNKVYSRVSHIRNQFIRNRDTSFY